MFPLSTDEWLAIELSLRVAFWSVWFSLPFALFFAWLLARRNFFWKNFGRRSHPFAAGFTTSRDRLYIAGNAWAKRPHRGMAIRGPRS